MYDEDVFIKYLFEKQNMKKEHLIFLKTIKPVRILIPLLTRLLRQQNR